MLPIQKVRRDETIGDIRDNVDNEVLDLVEELHLVGGGVGEGEKGE